MSANLVAAGHTVRGFDPVAVTAMAASDKGVAVSYAEVIFTMLPHGAAVKRCYAEILPAASQGALLIDSSTISVDDAREVHASAASLGFAQIDAPVSGGVKGAVAGTLAFMVAVIEMLRAGDRRMQKP
jgi:3-hydroxyisobutyrate dehydrogenase